MIQSRFFLQSIYKIKQLEKKLTIQCPPKVLGQTLSFWDLALFWEKSYISMWLTCIFCVSCMLNTEIYLRALKSHV